MEPNVSYIEPLDELEQVVEALLFVTEEPLRAGRIAETYAAVTGASEPSENEIIACIDQLNTLYDQRNNAIRIHKWAGGYRIGTRSEVKHFIQTFREERRERKLSKSLMETVAIIAYKQPVTRPEIEAIRGVDSDYGVRKLLDLGLVTVRGRSDTLGRPLLYGTTPKFLDVFGLPRIKDLPDLREIADILNEPTFSKERMELLTLQRSEDGNPVLGLPENGASHE